MNPLKHLILLVSVLMLSLISCATSDKVQTSYCGSANPLEDIPWLKKIKTEMEMSARAAGGQIIRYSYKGEDVFWIDRCHGCNDDLITVYNCKGDVICEFGGIAGLNSCPDFQTEASDSTMLYNGVQQ